MENNSYFIAKFGQRRHLESLKSGVLHLRAINNYRTDSTYYRGDENEGVVPISPKGVMIDGIDISNLVQGYIKQTVIGDESLLLFCASIIDTSCLCPASNNFMTLTDSFKQAVKPFGTSVLLISTHEITDKLRHQQLNYKPEFGFVAGPVIYRNLEDFTNDDEYKRIYNLTGSNYDRYFVKHNSYQAQNEWRLIVDGTYTHLPVNHDGSYEINIGQLESALIFDTDIFLDTFQIQLD